MSLTHQKDRYLLICAGGTGWALPESYKMTSTRSLVWMSLTKKSETVCGEVGLRARHPLVGPVLTAWHHGARLEFAIMHQNWQVCPWRSVLFTNESRFTLNTCDRCERVWRSCGEHYAPWNIVQRDRSGGGSVMVWGGISMEGCTDLYSLDNGTLTAWVPPGAQKCSPSLCKSMQAVPGGWNNWYHWMAPTLTWPKSNRTPLGNYVWGCTSDCPGAQWSPGPDLGGNTPGHHTLSL